MKIKIVITLLIISTCVAFSQAEIDLNKTGIKYAELGQYEKALHYFSKAIELNPNYANGYANRGNVYRVQKKLDKAIVEYSKAIELDNTKIQVLYARANTYKDLDNLALAIIDYSKIIALDNSFKDIYFARAYAYLMLEDYKKAKVDLEKQLQISPNDLKSEGNLIHIKTKLGLYDEALTDYDITINKYPTEYSMYNNRAELFIKMNKL